MKSTFTAVKDLLWTDGGEGGRAGYFDRAGGFNEVLMQMFAGKDDCCNRRENPCRVSLMEQVKYGTRVRLVVSLEIDGEQ